MWVDESERRRKEWKDNGFPGIYIPHGRLISGLLCFFSFLCCLFALQVKTKRVSFSLTKLIISAVCVCKFVCLPLVFFLPLRCSLHSLCIKTWDEMEGRWFGWKCIYVCFERV